MYSAMFIVACGEKKDPATYNNELITIINDNEKNITEMNAAMTSEDYAKAGEVRKGWESKLEEQIKKVAELGDFNGDEGMQKGVLNGLKAYQKIVKEDYVKLIDIRSSKKEDPTGEQEALDHINSAFETAANEVNEAATAFEKKYAQ